MPKETSKVGRLGEMKHFSATLEANSADLTHVEVSCKAFADVVTRAEGLVRQQAAFAAAKQQSSQELNVVLDEGERLFTLLRFAVKQRYGRRSEKLAEFRMQPFRGLKRNAKPAPGEPTTPTEPDPEKTVQPAPSDSTL